MSSWITKFFLPFGIFFASLMAQFYLRWVPNVEDQKRHVKNALSWLVDIASVGICVYWLYGIAQEKGPITPVFVVTASLAAANTFLVVVLIGAKRVFRRQTERILNLFDRQLGVTEGNLDHMDTLIGVAEMHNAALLHIANDACLSTDTRNALSHILPQDPKPRISAQAQE